MMHILPIRNPLIVSLSDGFVPPYLGGDPVPTPIHILPYNENTGIIPPFMNGSQATTGISHLGTVPGK